jgi:hypothetical protein
VVTHPTATVSAFYGDLDSREERFLAVFAGAVERLAHAAREAAVREQGWQSWIHRGLEALLAALDDEPRRARLLLGDSPLTETVAEECRQRLQRVLGELIEGEGGPSATADEQAQALRRELVASGVFSVIRRRMLAAQARPLVELAPSLTAFIVASCRADAEALGGSEPKPAGKSARVGGAGRLPIRATQRTLLVLRAIATAPRLSNREIAEAGGLSDEGQTSRLLGRLERHGLIENVGRGHASGEPNAWLLTAAGERVAKQISDGFAASASARASKRVRGAT